MMFIRMPIERLLDTSHQTDEKGTDIALKRLDQPALFQEIVNDLVDGVLVLTSQGKLVYTNDCASRILRQIGATRSSDDVIPQEIRYIAESLAEARLLFPDQHWYLKARVFLNSSIVFSVQARWIKLEGLKFPCILLVLKDKYQMIKAIALEEARKFGLTCREQEIWLLHRANYTYKQIAEELYITPNTVKKHMKNIHLKQKELPWGLAS